MFQHELSSQQAARIVGDLAQPLLQRQFLFRCGARQRITLRRRLLLCRLFLLCGLLWDLLRDRRVSTLWSNIIFRLLLRVLLFITLRGWFVLRVLLLTGLLLRLLFLSRALLRLILLRRLLIVLLLRLRVLSLFLLLPLFLSLFLLLIGLLLLTALLLLIEEFFAANRD